MSFDFSTLVTDRSQADLDTLRALLAVPLADWTAEQLAQFNQAISKGAYNYTDLNRVTACMDYLNEVLTGLGYETGYQRIVVHNPPQSFPVILSVNTAVVGTVWEFFVDRTSVTGPSDTVHIIAYHPQWDSGMRQVHFTVSGANAIAEGGSSSISPQLFPNNLQATFSINLSDISAQVEINITSVTG